MRYVDLLEGRDAPLYHNMSPEKATNVFENDVLEARWKHYFEGREVYGNSFTRNPRMSRRIGSNFGPYMIEVDQTKLSRTHKIIPVDGEQSIRLSFRIGDLGHRRLDDLSDEEKEALRGHYRDEREGRFRDRLLRGEQGDYAAGPMAEEFVVGDIVPLHEYVTKIFILRNDKVDLSPWLVRDIQEYGKKHDIRVIDSADKRIKTYRVVGPYRDGPYVPAKKRPSDS